MATFVEVHQIGTPAITTKFGEEQVNNIPGAVGWKLAVKLGEGVGDLAGG
jgi:hypothetical protein